MMLFYQKVRFWQLWKKYILRAFANDREPFPVGNTLLRDVDEIDTRLIIVGYQPNYFSYGDRDQITSMRKMYIDSEGCWRQVHVRVFDDGEIRMHDELSYEEDAVSHLDAKTLKFPGHDEMIKVLSALGGVLG